MMSPIQVAGRSRWFKIASLALFAPALFFVGGSAASDKHPAVPGPVHFYANLSAEEETTAAESQAQGRADFSLDRKTLQLSWNVKFTGLSDVTGATVNGPERVGVNGSILYTLASKDAQSPIQGSKVMSEGELQYLMERHLYVNITTAKYPAGEIRGQINRCPSERCDR
jgi:hypothetical protein